jgi:hypothetical protein
MPASRASGLFIHLSLSESLVTKISPETGGKYMVTTQGAQCRQKAYIQWGAAWFPKGTVYDIVLHPQCMQLLAR